MTENPAVRDQLGAEAYLGPLPGARAPVLVRLRKQLRSVARLREDANRAVARTLRRLRS